MHGHVTLGSGQHRTDMPELAFAARALGAREYSARAVAVVVRELRDRVDGRDAGIVGGERRHPLVTRSGAKRRAEIRANLVLTSVVRLMRDPALATERAAEIGEELRL